LSIWTVGVAFSWLIFLSFCRLWEPTGSVRGNEKLEHDPEKWKLVFREDHAQTRARA
jgi:hypothetical protein